MKPSVIVYAALAAFFFISAPAVSAEALAGKAIGIFGDSLGDGVWSGMYNLAKKHPGDKLFRHAKVGSGLTRGDFATWIVELGAELDADHPTNAVMIIGVNDQQSIRDENHKGYLFKSEGWKRVYLSRVDAIMAEFEKRKIPVIWFGLPVFRDADLNAGGIYMSDLIAGELKQHSATFVPLIDTFKDAKGEFASHLPDEAGKVHAVRADDGVHFTPYGYQLIGEKAYVAMVALTASPVDVPATSAPATTSTAPVATTPEPTNIH